MQLKMARTAAISKNVDAALKQAVADAKKVMNVI